MKKYFKAMAVIIAILPLVVVQSCKKTEDDPFADNTFLVSAERVGTYTVDNVKQVLGLLVTEYPAMADVVSDVVSGVIVYKIVYHTTFFGEDLLVSGIVAIPSRTGSYPVLSYQNGTNTLYKNAPTNIPQDPDMYMLYEILEFTASTGYVTIISDYIGFGESKQKAHPYLHKESTVRTVIDMLYSLSEFDEDVAKDITIENEYYLMGYSQGGWATLALLEALDQDYSTEFTVKGAVCGAGPYDLNYFHSYVLGLSSYPMPVFLGYIAHAYDEYNLFSNPLSDMFISPYDQKILTAYNGLNSSSDINAILTTSIPGLFKADYISGFASSASYQSVRDALSENSITAWDTQVPILFLHGEDDVYMPPVISENTHNAMITAGTSSLICTYSTFPGIDHSEGIVPSGLAGLAFFKTIREL